MVFQNPRDRSNRLLFALFLNLALSVGAAGLLHLSSSELEANFWNKWPYILAIPSYILGHFSQLQIADIYDRCVRRSDLLDISNRSALARNFRSLLYILRSSTGLNVVISNS